MTQLNSVGEALGSQAGVHAMTDVTGFGLCGHLLEVCRGSGLAAEVEVDKVGGWQQAWKCVSNLCVLWGWQNEGKGMDGCDVLGRFWPVWFLAGGVQGQRAGS
jgi:hypothetical protein